MPDSTALPSPDCNRDARLALNHELTDAIAAYALSMHALRRMVGFVPMDRPRVSEVFGDVAAQTERAINLLRRLKRLDE